jgi:hypothetical protein
VAEGDDVGMVQIFAQAQPAPRYWDSAARGVLCARSRAHRSRAICRTWRPATGGRGTSRAPDALRDVGAKVFVGLGRLDEAPAVQGLQGGVGHPVRVGGECGAAPGGPQPRRLQVLEEPGGDVAAEENTARFAERVPMRCVHDRFSCYTGTPARYKERP